jgi:macrodomain Ter protein organizer (MatP/YcbG family)
MSFNPETKTISMHNKLVKWQTARKIKAELPKLQFLKNFSLFDPIAAKLWSELVEYVRLNGVDLIKQGDTISELENYADKVTEFQLFVVEHKGNDQAIAAKSKQLFETNEEGSFKDAVGIEFEPYQKLQQLLEAAAPVQLMLNTCNKLVESAVIDYKLEQEIKDYLSYKGYISLPEPASAPTLQVAEQAELIEA